MVHSARELSVFPPGLVLLLVASLNSAAPQPHALRRQRALGLLRLRNGHIAAQCTRTNGRHRAGDGGTRAAATARRVLSLLKTG